MPDWLIGGVNLQREIKLVKMVKPVGSSIYGVESASEEAMKW